MTASSCSLISRLTELSLTCHQKTGHTLTRSPSHMHVCTLKPASPSLEPLEPLCFTRGLHCRACEREVADSKSVHVIEIIHGAVNSTQIQPYRNVHFGKRYKTRASREAVTSRACGAASFCRHDDNRAAQVAFVIVIKPCFQKISMEKETANVWRVSPLNVPSSEKRVARQHKSMGAEHKPIN